ncbi:meiosis-specific coiled-coil domain-containing protein MEIOC [Esox lucius]|uniref:Meiosis specific with coiled-coil domain n=1 Tax=Esox lucius TaxID=8010 RepID=A0A3P8YTL5_ESOLU|nr:meiosis-specific coiled-coil domain-containing protein MEIOC [Esox lucius]
MEVNNAVRNGISASSRGVRMAFDRFQSSASSGSDSFFSLYKHQASGTGDNGRTSLPYTPLPYFSPQEEHLMSFTPWSAQDDAYQLNDRTQNSIKSRNVPDGNDCGSEADLYGLVSNILEEADQMDPHFNEETSTHLKTVWSPKSMRGECQPYFQSESKMQSNAAFLPNHVYPESSSKGQGQPMNRDSEEFYHHFNGFDTCDQQFFHLSCNGDTDIGYSENQELPKTPGLSPPSVGNAYMSKMRQSKHNFNEAESLLGFWGSGNASADHMDAFLSSVCPQSKMNSQPFDHYYVEYPGQSSAKPRSTTQYTMQDVSKLASNIQALMAGDKVTESGRDSENRQSVQMQYDDIMAEQRNFSSSNLPGRSTQAMQFKKELGGEYGAMRREGDGGMKSKQPLQSDFGSKELTGFGPQNNEYFQPPKALSAPFNSPNSYLNKMAAQKGSNPASTGLILNHHNQQQDKLKQCQPRGNCLSSGPSKILSHSVSEFVPQHFHQYIQDYSQGDGPGLHSNRAGQYQVGVGLGGLRSGGSEDVFEMRLDRGRMHMAGPAAGSCWDGKTRPQTGLRTRGDGDEEQGLLQNPYLDLLSSMYGSQRSGGAHGIVNPGKSPAFLPYAYQAMNNPGPKTCHVPLNSASFHSRSSFPYGSPAPTVDLCGLLPEWKFGAFSPYLDDAMSSSRENLNTGLMAGLRSDRMMRNRGGAMSQLHFYLEECYEQWRVLEKERKKTEMVLTKSYPGKRISVVTSSAVPRIPPNPSRVDRLIVDQIREQAKVTSLLGKMERLRSFPLHANICSALDRHLEAIYITQARRKEEFVNTSNRQRQDGTHFREERDILLLATALRDLCLTTRKSRTALWCALQMTLPKSTADTPDEHGDTESTCEKTSPGRTLVRF